MFRNYYMQPKLNLIGVSHKTAPVEIREQLAITAPRIKEALRLFLAQGKGGVVILSTCNRTEIYASESDSAVLLGFLEDYFQLQRFDFKRYLYHYQGLKATDHLFRVACGLDSMIIGEGQILGQIKVAWQTSMEAGATDEWLNAIFNRALRVGKRSRFETRISRGAVSVGSAAVALAKNIFGKLELRQVLIVGAGKMGEAAAKILGAKTIFVANRTYQRACELAEKVGGRAVNFNQLDALLEKCDIVISSTGSSHYILTLPRIQKALLSRCDPLFLIDIAVPRDIDPRVGKLSQVFLYDVDDLNTVAAENLIERQREIPKVERIIEEEVEELSKKLTTPANHIYKLVQALGRRRYVRSFQDLINGK